MPRHANYLPHGVIPAVLLPFHDDLSIDEKSFRSHLRDVAAMDGISAITINAHSTEVASCSFDEQRRVLAIAQDEIGERCRSSTASGRTAVSRPRASRAWRRTAAPRRCWCSRRRRSRSASRRRWRSRIQAHRRRQRSADHRVPVSARDRPGLSARQLLRMCEEVPTIRAIKDWSGNVPQHEMHVRTLQSCRGR